MGSHAHTYRTSGFILLMKTVEGITCFLGQFNCGIINPKRGATAKLVTLRLVNKSFLELMEEKSALHGKSYTHFCQLSCQL